jgi:hypothetical protein
MSEWELRESFGCVSHLVKSPGQAGAFRTTACGKKIRTFTTGDLLPSCRVCNRIASGATVGLRWKT